MIFNSRFLLFVGIKHNKNCRIDQVNATNGNFSFHAQNRSFKIYLILLSSRGATGNTTIRVAGINNFLKIKRARHLTYRINCIT